MGKNHGAACIVRRKEKRATARVEAAAAAKVAAEEAAAAEKEAAAAAKAKEAEEKGQYFVPLFWFPPCWSTYVNIPFFYPTTSHFFSSSNGRVTLSPFLLLTYSLSLSLYGMLIHISSITTSLFPSLNSGRSSSRSSSPTSRRASSGIKLSPFLNSASRLSRTCQTCMCT